MVDIIPVLPILIVTSAAILAIAGDLTKWSRQIGLILSITATLIAFILTIISFGDEAYFIEGNEKTESLFAFDDLSRLFVLIFIIASLSVILISNRTLKSEFQSNPGLFYSLLLFSTAGMMLVASATDLISLLVAWELGSIPTYPMVAFAKQNKEQGEAALKYFMIGAISTAMIVYGISLVYGLVGTTNLYLLADILTENEEPLEFLAMAFVLAGFGYKMGIVPFHAWIPDVYQESETSITTFLAAGTKKMGFVAAIRIFIVGLTALSDQWSMVFAIVAIATMTLGNVVALVQDDLKRMLAYSSIAHAGYILIAFAVVSSAENAEHSEWAFIGVIFHVLAHTLMKIAAFVSVGYFSNKTGTQKIGELTGIGNRFPLVGLAFSITLLSLMGIPPLGGFISKFILFYAAVDGGMGWLAVIAVLNSALSVYYYAQVMIKIWTPNDKDSNGENETSTKMRLETAVILIATLGIILMGIFAQPIFWAADKAVTAL